MYNKCLIEPDFLRSPCNTKQIEVKTKRKQQITIIIYLNIYALYFVGPNEYQSQHIAALNMLNLSLLFDSYGWFWIVFKSKHCKQNKTFLCLYLTYIVKRIRCTIGAVRDQPCDAEREVVMNRFCELLPVQYELHYSRADGWRPEAFCVCVESVQNKITFIICIFIYI